MSRPEACIGDRKEVQGLLKTILIIFQVIFSLGLITSILLQSGRASGLSGAIAGGAASLLGKKKGLDEFLNKVSAALAAGFLILTLMMAFV
jgi:preprotein translocase subunit SecG